jgi:hypothetical protein
VLGGSYAVVEKKRKGRGGPLGYAGKRERRWRAGRAGVLAHGLYKELKYFSISQFFYRLQTHLNSNQIFE